MLAVTYCRAAKLLANELLSPSLRRPIGWPPIPTGEMQATRLAMSQQVIIKLINRLPKSIALPPGRRYNKIRAEFDTNELGSVSLLLFGNNKIA